MQKWAEVLKTAFARKTCQVNVVEYKNVSLDADFHPFLMLKMTRVLPDSTDLFGFLSSSWVQKIKITKDGTLWRHQKVWRKRFTKLKLSVLSSNEKSF